MPDLMRLDALARAGAACLDAHGRHSSRPDDLPPTVFLDVSAATDLESSDDVTVMDDPVLGSVWRLLEC